MGERFAYYELEQRLGSGAMGEVWRAVDTRLARPVALKRLAAGRLEDADARARFLRESRAASALNHPNIVTVFEAGNHEGEPYIVMELIEGRTLRDLLNQGEVPRERCLDVAQQFLSGLAVAHAAGIIHRDIKPENLMIRTDGYVKILDFGLASMLSATERLTHSDGLLGTPLYMSPEQATGQPLDARADVYSAATVIYEMIAGSPPFRGNSVYEIIAKMMEEAPSPLVGISSDLNAMIMRGLEKDPAARFVDAVAMLDALRTATHSRQERATHVESASLLVLPMACSEQDQEIVDGITDELIASLEGLGGLRVIARSTSMRYRGMTVDARAVGRELNVEMVLEGSVRRSGNRFRVTAGLIETRTGFMLWSGRFEAKCDDVFDLQDEISRNIVEALRERFATLPSLRAGVTAALKTEANELYMRGVRMLDTLTPENILSAVEALERAVKLAPEFAAAHARLAQALVQKVNFISPGLDTRDLLERARFSATEALRIDPSNPDAHFGLAFLYTSRVTRDWRAGRRQLRHALSLSPNHVPSLSWMAFLQTMLGNAQDAENYARRAISRDPHGVSHFIWLCFALLSQRRFEDSADAAERALRLDPKHPFIHASLLLLDLWRGRTADAAQFVDFLARFPVRNSFLVSVQLAYRAYTQGLRWQEVSDGDRSTVGEHVISLRMAADIPALNGDVEGTVSLLRRAHAYGDRNLPLLDADPFLDRVRDSDAFQMFRGEVAKEIAEDPEQ